MNTRFAAIAGTLLVGLSLFVTSLISQNLNNAALTTSSEAQTSCSATVSPVSGQKSRRPCDPSKGDVCTDPAGNAIRFVDCWWKFDVQCSNGNKKRIGPRCMSVAEAQAYVAANIESICSCTPAGSTSTPPPAGSTNTPPVGNTNTPIPTTDLTQYPRQITNTPAPTRSACSEPGYACSATQPCCGGAACQGGICAVVTPTPCIETGGGPVPGRCAPAGTIRCCQTTPPALCFESEFGGQWYARCDVPPASPTPQNTPKPFGSACFYEKCTSNGAPCGREGESCYPVNGAGGSANCADPLVDCRCVKNKLCAVFNSSDPRAEECWCLDTEYCPKDGGNVPCSLRRAREGNDDCKRFSPHLTCKDQGGFGVCDSDFCPRDPAAASYILKVKQEIDKNPALLDIIEKNGAIQSGELLRQGSIIQSPFQRFLQLFGF